MVETPRGIFAGLRLRYFSSQPLIEDDTERQPSSTIVNALVGYRFGRYELSAAVLNLLDSHADDIAYFYGSRLQAIPGHPSNRSRFAPLTSRRTSGSPSRRRWAG